jgi:fermentation-respiration switch protein FrsA (DUF1100 family)
MLRRFIRLAPMLLFPLSFLSCSSLFYYPSRQFYYSPKRLGYEAHEIPFKSRDGKQLYGWYFPVPQGAGIKGTIIQFHGNAENMSSHYLSLAWLAEQGYQLFTFDYRGYGKSEGEPTQQGTYDDALAALDQAWKLHAEKAARRFIIDGQSLGGAIAMRASADFAHKSEVSLIVLDSTFVSYKSVARKKLASFWLTWPFSWLGDLLVSDEYSAEKALQENQTRLLVIHDENDPAVPFSCSEDFYPLAKSPKDFWKPHDGRHIAAFSDPHSPYRRSFLELLDSL